MTVIVGLVAGGRTLIAGDSAGIEGYQRTVRRDPKVFTHHGYAFGFTDSFRMGQLLRWSFEPPPPPDDDGSGLDQFMATTWIDHLRQTLRDGGWARIEQARETAGRFLVGTRGRLFLVDGDYQVGESADGYDAIGGGAEPALGALHATTDNAMVAEDRALAALRAAVHHSAACAAPFTLAWEDQ